MEPNKNVPRQFLERMLKSGCRANDKRSTRASLNMKPTKLLLTLLGGQDRFAQLEKAYNKARPRRGRWGPGILTAEEVFRQQAREDGFSDEDIANFIEHAAP